jgi:hypothetical protein
LDGILEVTPQRRSGDLGGHSLFHGDRYIFLVYRHSSRD